VPTNRSFRQPVPVKKRREGVHLPSVSGRRGGRQNANKEKEKRVICQLEKGKDGRNEPQTSRIARGGESRGKLPNLEPGLVGGKKRKRQHSSRKDERKKELISCRVLKNKTKDNGKEDEKRNESSKGQDPLRGEKLKAVRMKKFGGDPGGS